MLVALGAVTVAAPVSGFVGPQSSVSMPSKQLGAVSAGADSWLIGQDDVEDSQGLDAIVAAASRARVRTPLQVGSCLAGLNPADGSRDVTELPSVQWPLDQSAYSYASPMGMRVNPVTGIYKLHEGADFAAPLDTPIYAAMDGVVTSVEDTSTAGRVVTIGHTLEDGTTVSTVYLHMYPDQVLVSQGQQVSAGERIGGVGTAGNSTGPHLHFEVRDAANQPLEPITWLQDHGAVFPGQGCS